MDRRLVGDELARIKVDLNDIGTRVLSGHLEAPLLYVELVSAWVSLGLMVDHVGAGVVAEKLDVLASKSLDPAEAP